MPSGLPSALSSALPSCLSRSLSFSIVLYRFPSFPTGSRLPRGCHGAAVGLHWSCHVAAMGPPRGCHVATMGLPCGRHGAATGLPHGCHGAAIGLPWGCHEGAKGLPWDPLGAPTGRHKWSPHGSPMVSQRQPAQCRGSPATARRQSDDSLAAIWPPPGDSLGYGTHNLGTVQQPQRRFKATAPPRSAPKTHMVANHVSFLCRYAELQLSPWAPHQ